MLSLLTKRCEVLRAERVDDGSGGDEETWSSVLSDYPCRIYGRGGRLERNERGEDDIHTVRLLAPVADIRCGDKVVVEGSAYLVSSVSTKEDGRGPRHLEATLNSQ